MPTPLDYLNAPEFADDQLTEAINIPPYLTGRPAQLGIFTDTPIHTTYVRIGVSEQELTVIPARERGGESNLNIRGDARSGVSFDIPHFPLDDAILPADIQNLTVWGEGDVIMASLEDVYNDRLVALRAKHDFTHSHLDWGALNGIVLDGDGRELLNVYDKFDLVEHSVEYDLASSATRLAGLNRQVKAHVRRELRGTPATGLRVLAGAKFFDMYVDHSNVREELRDYKGSTANPGRDDIQDVFEYAGLTLERIDEQYQVRQSNGTLVARDAVPEDEAIVVPLGTPFFKRYIAPPDTISGANRAPEAETKVFVSTDELPHGKGREIHTESNVLPICIRPQLLVRLRMKAA
ncbi:major capsid protein [Rhizobium pusense]|uniref:major capsid protein n=1 Tax=Rhizobium/Agrobacterium group TaxID=227290 RepID=UPI000D19C7FD|nr:MULTISPECIES: major capsid protein [Rhizobium/Agrobacterium group]QXC52082.1 major capsid protein [Agrobacterium salinitolerans]MDH0910656.1 major capsid protein [Agrobacterium pusense]MDH1095588.1 major capsid protein [Agrobacterium pusense]MDH1113234.1 major capsid protein [Agrobacterium pusense]MDH2192928.1 major capsid protein [Agrobacterium pusense]